MGLYPATPDHRLHFHRDGATGFWIDDMNLVTQMTSQELASFDDEQDVDINGIGNAIRYWGFIFPAAIDLSRYWVGYVPGVATIAELATSPDTINGLDGTWTTRANPFVASALTKPGYRTDIQTVTGGAGIVGVRFHVTANQTTSTRLWGIHLYGSPSTLTDLQIWHPTLDQRLAADAFYQGANQGDVAQGGSYDVTFRVKNLHGTQTANSVVVQTESRAGSTEQGGWLTYSQGGAFAASQNIGNLAPGAISSVLTLRVAPPTTAGLSLGSPSVVAVAGSWT